MPAAITTFGLRRSGGPAGIRLTADGLAFKARTAGEIAAVDRMCAAIPRDASVVFIGGTDGGDADRLTQVVRGMCGVPAAQHRPRRARGVEQVVRGIEQAGAAGAPGRACRAAHPVRRPGHGRSCGCARTQDKNALTAPPTHTLPLPVNVWMSEPPDDRRPARPPVTAA